MTISGLELAEAQQLGGEKVASLEAIKLTRSLWQAARGRQCDVLLCSLWADCSLTPNGQPRLSRAMEVCLEHMVYLPQQGHLKPAQEDVHALRVGSVGCRCFWSAADNCDLGASLH